MRSWVLVVPLAILLAACQSAPPGLSLEEAKKVTADFGGAGFVTPPRTIDDIAAVLNSEKPDPSKYSRYVARADARPAADASTAALARFYVDRAVAAGEIGRVKQAIADGKEALRLSETANLAATKFEAFQVLMAAEERMGNLATSIAYSQRQLTSEQSSKTLHATLARLYAAAGRLQEAHSELQLTKLEAQGAVSPGLYNRGLQAAVGYNWGVKELESWREARVAGAIGSVYMAEGRYVDAEREYARSLALTEIALRGYDQWPGLKLPREIAQGSVSSIRLAIASVVAQQGRFAEAESIARRALLESLHQQGRYSLLTGRAVDYLANIVLEEGRPEDARRLAEGALEIYHRIGASDDAGRVTQIRVTTANTLAVEGKWHEAMIVYDEAGANIGVDDALARTLFDGNLNRIVTEIKVGRANDAFTQVSVVAQRREQLLGEAHPDTLEAQGVHAAALYAAGQRDEALTIFRAVVPRLIQAARLSDAGEGSPTLRAMRLRFVLESYLALLSETKDEAAAAEAFAIADVVSRQSVQRMLLQSAARSSLRDPALAELVRREQDAGMQVNALFALLAKVQAAPADQRADTAVVGLRADIDRLRAARAALREEIEKRFPDYANLINPEPATVAQVQAALQPGEAVITTYVAEDRTYVWAVPKQGPVLFAAAPLTRSEVRAMVIELRKALDPKVSILGDIPPFDVALASRLHGAILAPMEPGWRGAKTLIVVPHGPLAEIPFSLLVTRPAEQPAEGRGGRALFSGYQEVPFLVREVAVIQLPSVAALVSLRGLPQASLSRKPFVGFGDPWFSAGQAAQARREQPNPVATLETRALHLRAAPTTETMASARLSALPPLPDTAREVREIAQALHADPALDVFLGAGANERQVRTMKLDDRRVVMFATHGLVPGDLDGLSQPALALTAPSVAQVDGDGLLTMEKILGLKLDADWVVLSACNTAAGDGAGAEAVSGLGRAFFYAGTRALLVTNWPVETTSARMLTTTVFQRQLADPSLSRAEALRASMLGLIDGPGYGDPVSGQVVFSYAHPIFWAPFSLVGDGR